MVSNEETHSLLRSKTKLPGAGVLVLARPRATRVKAPKTRSGCKECKRRRIKCDEGKPACRRCVSSGRQCNISLSHAIIPSSHKGKFQADSRILAEPNYALSLFSNQRQWDMFSIFLFTNTQAGTLPVSTLSALTPQIAQQDVAVREICCAIGAATNAFTDINSHPSADEAQYNISLLHYSRALRAVRELDSTPSALLTVAIVSLLFVTYDMLRGDMPTAFAHFDHCHRIVESYFDEKWKDAGLPFSELRFSALESAVFEMTQRLTTYPWALDLGFAGSKVDHKLQKCRQHGRHKHLVRNMPESFRDLAQALKWWDVSQHFLLHHMEASIPHGRSMSQSWSAKASYDCSALPKLASKLEQQHATFKSADWTEESFSTLYSWHNSFVPLLQSARQRKDEDPYSYLNACTLETLYLESLTSLHLHHRRNSNVLPDVKPIYLEIIQTAREMQRHCNNPAVLDNAIMRPVLFVLYKCRDVEVRQGIKEILEGSDKSSQMAVPLLSMMNLKEGEEVPQKLRNIERSMGWYFTACGCSSGPLSISQLESVSGE